MQESETYQAILDIGRIEGIHRALLIMGRSAFGEPTEADRRALLAIEDLGRLDRLADRMLKVSTWKELLVMPGPIAGVQETGEADISQALLDAVRIDGIQRLLLLQGRKKFGEPDDVHLRALLAINDLERLNRVSERLREVWNWHLLLETPWSMRGAYGKSAASAAYSEVLEDGSVVINVEGAQSVMLWMGTARLGEPDEESPKAVLGLRDVDQIAELVGHLSSVSTWQEFLAPALG